MNIGAIRASLVKKSKHIQPCSDFNLYWIKPEWISELQDSEFYFSSCLSQQLLILKV